MIKRIVKMSFQPERAEEFRAVFESNKQRIGSFPGCTHLELWQDVDDPATFFTYSFWESPEHLEQYRRSEVFKSVWSLTKPLFRDKAQAWSVTQL
jgi:quinol monooxygenase YgiN